MNVFVLSRDHEKRAQYHCDTHVNKMLLESAQLLNTALHLNDADKELTFYQPTHANHPWTKWATRRYANWEWLFEHAMALGDEFLYRSDKDRHATREKMRDNWELRYDNESDRRRWISRHFDEEGERTAFPQCMPDEYTVPGDPVDAYRSYYVGEKVPEDWCTWSTEVPDWVFDKQ